MDFLETKTDATEDAAALMDLQPLYEGSTFIKLTANGEPLERTYCLSEDNRYIRWNSNFWAFKSEDNKQIDVHSIKRIQRGQLSAKFERWKPILQCAAGRSFSIVHGDDPRTLDLIADSEEQLEEWYRGLKQVMRDVVAAREKMNPDQLYVQSSFESAGSKSHSPNKSMDLTDLHNAIHRMNHPISNKALDEVVVRVCGGLDKEFTRSDFGDIIKTVRRRYDMEHLWSMLVSKSFDEEWTSSTRRLGIARTTTANDELRLLDQSPPDETIQVSDFLEFWKLFQGGDDATAEGVALLTDTVVEEDSSEQPRELSYAQFLSIMSSHANDIYNPKAMQQGYDTFRRPLSCYFIASSHNTYLSGDQLTGSCALDRYVDVLERGCRSVELHCWDGVPDSDTPYMPVVAHGKSYSDSIAFDEVIRAISENAFGLSTAGTVNDMPLIVSLKCNCSWEQQKVMADILKDELGELLLPRGFGVVDGQLPTPWDLRGKVLLKGRRIEGKTNNELYKLFYFSTSHSSDFTEDAACTVVNSCDDAEASRRIGDSVMGDAWTRHNMTCISRVYAGGARVRSSNMNPTAAWAKGAQMVALNYQSEGLPMYLNHGKFLQNKGCGYVLRPEHLNQPSANPLTARSISVHIIGGSQLPMPRNVVISPCVMVNLCGVQADTAERKTKSVEHNGFNPVWDEAFTFVVTNPDSAHLVLRVMDPGLSRNDFIAFASIPVVNLREGFRSVSLFNKDATRGGAVAHSSLFVRIVSTGL